jgi:hypothetical protein
MHEYTLSHLSDAVLLRDLATLVTRDRLTTASLLAHLAEVDSRRLYVPAGYSSMHAYCVDELHLSDDGAKKRIQASRAARQFPGLFAALADGSLHLTAVCLLAPYLTAENAEELIEAAAHKRKFEIEEWIARRFTLSQMPAKAMAVISAAPQGALAHPGTEALAPGLLDEGALAHPENSQATNTPQTSGRFLIQLTVEKSTRDKLRHAQALLSHAVPSGDVAEVMDRALDALIERLEKRKFGGASRQQRCRRTIVGNRERLASRHVPVLVKRAVWERDQGQCTFESVSGKRCNARRFLEFDHVDPVAQGGTATVDRMRLRCRAHNQYEAERAFGAGFMNGKRHEARLARQEGRLAKEKARAQTDAEEQSKDVLAGLRSLGCSAHEARRAVEFSMTTHCPTLEERVRAALKYLSRRSTG